MTRDEALVLQAELEELLTMGPGGISDRHRTRLRQIELTFRMAEEPDAYLRTKIREACGRLEIWLSPRKWQRWGSNPDRFRAIVGNAVTKARLAIEDRFRPGEERRPHGATR